MTPPAARVVRSWRTLGGTLRVLDDGRAVLDGPVVVLLDGVGGTPLGCYDTLRDALTAPRACR